MSQPQIMRKIIHMLSVVSAMAVGSSSFAQTNTDELAQLNLRVTQLEKQVKDISEFLEPLKGQQSTIASRRKALQEKVQARFALDRDAYTSEQVLDAEKLYVLVSTKPSSMIASNSFQALLTNYPHMDRTGCAALYMAQRSQGDEHAKNLQECIDKYSDCMYGDGVQVGAFARFLLAREYSRLGLDKKAEALSDELKTQYPDAVDHAGTLLIDMKITK